MQLTLCPLFSGSSGNSIYMACGGVKLLVDAGMSAARVEANLREIGVDIRNIDAILITHEHGDHLDPKAISAVEKEGSILIANANSQKKLGKGVVMKNGDRLQPAGWFTLDAVPAYNTTPGREIYHPKDRDNGYVLTFGGTRVYIAGDTEDIPEMQKLKDIDIAFLPVNQPYTMTVPQADHAARMVNPRVLYPYHYGDTNVAELKSSLKDVPGIDVRIRQLQ